MLPKDNTDNKNLCFRIISETEVFSSSALSYLAFKPVYMLFHINP